MLVQHRHNLIRFDAVATNFDLMVVAPQKCNLTIRQEVGKITRLVQAGIGVIAERMGDKLFGSEFRTVEIASCQACPPDV